MKFEFLEGFDHPASIEGVKKLRAYNASKNCPTNGAQLTLIMEDDEGNPAATLRLTKEFNWIFINAIYVEHQGKGYGRIAMEYVEEWARKEGHTGITLVTQTFQTPKFYDALGYQVVGQIPDFINGHARLFYAKRFSH